MRIKILYSLLDTGGERMKDKEDDYFLAKSNPIQTISEHTDELLKNLDILIKLYPNLFLNWDTLYLIELACLYHDIGKINRFFQEVIRGKKIVQPLPHVFFSLCFLGGKEFYKEIKKLYEEKGIDSKEVRKKAEIFIKILANAIAYHHERDIVGNYIKVMEENLEDLKSRFEKLNYNKLKNKNVKILPINFFTGERITLDDGKEVFNKYILIKGLLNRIDYAASSGEDIEVEKENNFLKECLEKMLEEWKERNPSSKWNELQRYMIENRDKNVIAIAQTGMGKTEAGLLWIGNTKGFFILPLKTAINSIYERIRMGIVKEKIEERVGLLHSDTKDIYMENFSESDTFDMYYESTKQLSLPLTICTLDQIFDFVYRYKGFEPKLATLSYSKIVLDEIQMYSPDLLAYVIRGLKDITRMGGKFAILTATFPKIIEDFLKREEIEFQVSPNFKKKELPLRHKVEIREERIDSDFILSSYKKNKVLVICNTVKEAQKIYEELLEKMKDIERVNLFHSKFIKRDRKKKEEDILKLGDKNNKDYGIWVSTQVVEASLDIDFDILITELSDLNGLFQRMGRCYRNRPLVEGVTNCYVFIGDEKQKNSGVGSVVDKEIYNFSREYLKKKLVGEIDENMKMTAISEIYTTENLEKTGYYKKIEEVLDYLEKVIAYEYNKEDIRKKFRDITSYEIIPRSIYQENQKEINELEKILNLEYLPKLDMESRKKQKKEKLLAKIKLKGFTMNVSGYEINQKVLSKSEILKLGKYDKIYILDCEYSFEKGYQRTKLEEEFLYTDRCL